jgi:hypothetical protein
MTVAGGGEGPRAGMAYMAVLCLTLVLGCLGLAFVYTLRTQAMSLGGRLQAMQAGYLAESAANRAIWRLLNEPRLETFVSRDSDDADQYANQNARVLNDKVELGKRWFVGLRFPDVNIPAGATIEVARVQFQASDTTDAATTLRIYGERDVTPATFAETFNNLSARTKTTAYVNWSSVQAWQQDAFYETPNIAAVIQEIVRRPGWVAGNSLVLLIRSENLNGERRAHAHDKEDRTPPVLHVVRRTADPPIGASAYTMHAYAGGRYGYTVRRPTATTFATVATVGAVDEGVARQSYVAFVKPKVLRRVIVDRVTDKQVNGQASVQWNHDVAGTNRLLVVCGSVDGVRRLTGVTYGGLPMTFLGSSIPSNVVRQVEMWGLVNPNTASQQIRATFDGSAEARLAAVSFINVDQSSPLGPFVCNAGTGAQTSLSVGSSLGGLVLDAIACGKTNAPVAVAADQTERWSSDGGATVWGAGSTRSGLSTVQVGWSLSSSCDWAAGGISIRRAPPAP